MEETKQLAACLADTMRPFLKLRETVFLCCPGSAVSPFGECAHEAVEQLGGIPVTWEGDRRWYSLLRQVFQVRATVIVGAPQLLLGLAKIARATHTPLAVRNAVLIGDCTQPWFRDGIRLGMDAVIHTFAIPMPLGVYAPCLARDPDPMLPQLDAQLLSWSSVLDYKVQKTQQGLSLEITVFPGLQLPAIPSGANITVRPWNPREDVPYCLEQL